MNARHQARVYLVSFTLLALFILAGIAFRFSSIRSAAVNPKPPTFSPLPTDIQGYSDLRLIQLLEEDLRGNLSEEDRKSLEAKLQILAAEVTQRAIGIQQLTASPRAHVTFVIPTLECCPQIRTGIIENPSVSFPKGEYSITNVWKELVNGSYVYVFVSALGSDPSQGVVLVEYDKPSFLRKYLTPTKSGAIRITRAEGLRLVMRSENNDTFYFDVPAQRFVSSLTEIVPTATPNVEQKNLTQTLPPGTPYP